MIGVTVLTAQTDWLNVALHDLNQIPQPQRGPRRNDGQLLNRYVQLIASEVVLNHRRHDQILLNLYHIRRERVKRQLGQFTLNNKRVFWLHWFEQQAWSLYTIHQTGSNINEENTQVKLRYEFLSDLELESVPREVIVEHYDQLNRQDPTSIMGTAIDVKSLQLFIDRCRDGIRTGQRWSRKQNKLVWASPDWTAKAKNNLKQAVQILRLTENGELLQPIKTSDFGRTYLAGINLQNCSKTVRHAALGHCFSVDFSVCSTAWRLHTAQQIDRTFTAPITLQFIRNKQAFRQRVAEIMGDRYTNRAKTVLTSIGFGADLNHKPWPSGADYELPALREIIGEDEIRALTDSAWFQAFLQEQHAMTDIIVSYALAEMSKTDIVDCVKDRAGRIQRTKIMAYLYQHAEADYLAILLNYIIKRFGRDEILLTVHDSVYTRHSFNMAEVNSLLQQANPYLMAERTEHWGHFEKTNDIPQAHDDPHKQQAEAFLQYWRDRQRTEGFYDGSGSGHYAGYYDGNR